VSAAVPWGTLVPLSGMGVAGRGSVAAAAALAATGGGDAEVQQLRAHYEWQVRRQDEELRALQQRMGRLEQRRAEVKESWERERQGLVREISRYAAVLTRYAIPLEEACEGASLEQPWVPASSLDAKMRRLNGLLLEDPPRKRLVGNRALAERTSPDDLEGSSTTAMPAGSIASTLQAMFPHATIRTQAPEAEDDVGIDRSPLGRGGANRIPREKAGSAGDRQPGAAVDAEVSELAERLEGTTQSQIDERAKRALQSLAPAEACEVLRKVEDLVMAQGGRCRNLSSILQSVCRKLERRSAWRGNIAVADGSTNGGSAGAPGRPRDLPGVADTTGLEQTAVLTRRQENAASRSGSEARASADENRAERRSSSRTWQRKRRDRADSEADGDEGPGNPNTVAQAVPRAAESNEASASDDVGSTAVGTANATHGSGPCRIGRRSDAGSSELDEASIEDGSGDEERETAASRNYWTPRRVERAAQRGFELRQRGEGWEMKLAMAALDPPITEAGIERYCEWLRARLSAFQEEHGPQALRHCCSEVDFSSNGLGNQAVWMLLETLAQYEVHAASLKLYKNRISQGGVLAMCEFIRANRRAGPVHEMHLSHNEIDDESALELLRTLQEQRPRYPPRRHPEGSHAAAGGGPVPVPVWLRLNQNRIRDPPSALRAIESEGISYCAARNAHGCGPGKCARAECPLVHLYLFADQAPRRRDRDRDGARDGAHGGGVGDANAGASRRKRGRKTRFRDQEPAGG